MFIHLIRTDSNAFLFIAEEYSIVYMYQFPYTFICLWTYGLLPRPVQFSRLVMSDSLRRYGLQHTKLPCPSPTPGACSNFESVMPSNHLLFSCPLLLPPSVLPSIRVFSSESALCIRWPVGVSAAASVLPVNIQDWFSLGLISLQSKGLSRVFSNTTVQKHQFFSAQLSL